MNEEIYNIFIKQITDLNEKCRLFEIENAKLITENKDIHIFNNYLLSEIEFLKSIGGNNINNTPEFDRLLNDYEINSNKNALTKLFDNFPNEYKNILTAIREKLPENIHELAEKYQFKNDLKLLIKSNKLIDDLKKNNEHFEIRGLFELVDKYIDSFNSNNKTAAYRHMKQALIYFPLTYKKQFLERIQAYQFKDFNEKLEKMLNELYEENNVITKKTNIKSKTTRLHPDYAKESITNLVNITKNNSQIRYRALLVIKGMEKKKRPSADINQFVKEINNYVIKKIIYENG
jgi:hypothetical protein